MHARHLLLGGPRGYVEGGDDADDGVVERILGAAGAAGSPRPEDVHSVRDNDPELTVSGLMPSGAPMGGLPCDEDAGRRETLGGG